MITIDHSISAGDRKITVFLGCGGRFHRYGQNGGVSGYLACVLCLVFVDEVHQEKPDEENILAL